MSVTRRSFLASAPAVLVPVAWAPPFGGQTPKPAAPSQASLSPTFPTQAPELAREMVGVSHSNLARVKELLALSPTLARASYDWGFGDWEDALGAASHVGNRDIAELLIANGARPTIFSAAMLGHLDTVRAFIVASPGVEAIPGPHGITLLRHAIAGGTRAQPVADYLKTLPSADSRPDSRPTPPEDLAELPGEYVFGSAASERITIGVSSNNILQFTRSGASARNLTCVGTRAYFPVGAPRVRIEFRAVSPGFVLRVLDPDLVLEARRRS